MKKLKFLCIVLLFGLFTFCSNNEDAELSQEAEEQFLNQLLVEIQSMASSEVCTDSSEWLFTSYGNKACGGPQGYIAYPKSIDTTNFLNMVEEHRRAQQKFNSKWEVISNCLLASEPKGISCKDGKPVFEY